MQKYNYTFLFLGNSRSWYVGHFFVNLILCGSTAVISLTLLLTYVCQQRFEGWEAAFMTALLCTSLYAWFL